MRSRSLPVILLLLLLFTFVEYAYATKPREAGIGIRYGYNSHQTYFTGTAEADNNAYIGTKGAESDYINNSSAIKIPVFVQLDEELIGNYFFTNWFFDITRLTQKDHPPLLKETTYPTLVNSQNYEVPTANTYTREFANFYPQYSSIIDNASNPSLSADYDVTKITFGKTWGFFYAPSKRDRWLTFGLGIGVNYIEGTYSINVCDPYLLSSEESTKVNLIGEFRDAICKKKTELYTAKINHFSYELNVPITLYSYIGDTFEFNFVEVKGFLSAPSPYLKFENALEPTFFYVTASVFSTVAYF